MTNPKKRTPVDWHKLIMVLARNDAEMSIPIKTALGKSDYIKWLAKKMKDEDNQELEDDLSCVAYIGPELFLDVLQSLLARQNEAQTKIILSTLKTGKHITAKALGKQIFTVGTTTEDKETACLCLEVLQNMNTPAAKLFTFFLKKHPNFKQDILARVVNANSREYSEISDSLDDNERDILDKTIFTLLLEIDPEWVILFISNYLDNVPRKFSMSEKNIDIVKTFLEEYREKNFNLPELEDTVFEAVPEKRERRNPIQTISELFFKKPQTKSKDKLTKFKEGVDAFGLDLLRQRH